MKINFTSTVFTPGSSAIQAKSFFGLAGSGMVGAMTSLPLTQTRTKPWLRKLILASARDSTSTSPTAYTMLSYSGVVKVAKLTGVS